MCIQVFYTNKDKTIITDFSEPHAKLPVKGKGQGSVALIPWGKRSFSFIAKCG
jgi:hypothetical protein